MNLEHLAPALAAPATYGRLDQYGEAVLVMPQHASMLDDRVFASHAIFSSRIATTVVAQPGGGALRYTNHRAIAFFTAADLPSRLGPGDRITRGWDGALFEITSAYRDGAALCCELEVISSRVH